MILLGIILSAAASILPALLYMIIIYWADRYEREPKLLAAATFLWGAIPAIIISLIAEIALGSPFVDAPGSLAEQLVAGGIIAPIVEELVKGMALLGIFYFRRQEFDGVLDGIVYGALVGFGFAMTENFLYFIGAFLETGLGELSILIFLRAIVFGLNHALYTGLIGLGLGLSRNTRSRRARFIWITTGFIAAILIHALHNLSAGLVEVNAAAFLINLLIAGGGLGLTLLTIGLAWQHERAVLLAELTPEVGHLLSQEELHRLTDHWRRPRTKSARQRSQRLVEYAFRKRRLRHLGPAHEPELLTELTTLRTQLLADQPAATA